MTIKAIVREFLQTHDRIGPDELNELKMLVVDIRGKMPSRRYLMDLMLATDVEIDRSIGGFPPDLRRRVHTSDPDLAAKSLIELSAEYAQARQADDRERAADCRRAVLHAKQRLVISANLSAKKRAEKQELRQWFIVWLETPELFPDWLELRRSGR